MTAPSKPSSDATARSGDDANIGGYARDQARALTTVCDKLRSEIDAALRQARSKIWHGAPVWFIDGFPVVGYSIKAGKVSLLFWNGQALGEPMLKPVGKHFAAEIRFADESELDPPAIRRCLKKAAKNVFKDYASLRAGTGPNPNK